MAGFEIDCNDGKGEASACHHVAEFFSVIKVMLSVLTSLFKGKFIIITSTE